MTLNYYFEVHPLCFEAESMILNNYLLKDYSETASVILNNLFQVRHDSADAALMILDNLVEAH